MKKIIFLIFMLFITTNVLAMCDFPEDFTCPEIKCSAGEFMGDDGQCYPCDVPLNISIDCIGHDKIVQLCPNRLTFHGCGIMSIPSEKECYNLYMYDDFSFWHILNPFANRNIGNRERINYTNHTCSYPYGIMPVY